MKMQGVSWKGFYYIFPYERETASESSPDYREVIICQMDDRIEELEEQLTKRTEAYRRVVVSNTEILKYVKEKFGVEI